MSIQEHSVEVLNRTATTNGMSVDEIYLRIWDKQQEWTGTRWNIITIFLSVSFALFGLSFLGQNLSISSNVLRITGLVIYWFTYFLYHRYSDWTKFLRAYLEELEKTRQTQLDLHTRWKKTKQTPFRKWTSITKLLFYFGLFYLMAVVLLWI
jgi:hypothetical protein